MFSHAVIARRRAVIRTEQRATSWTVDAQRQELFPARFAFVDKSSNANLDQRTPVRVVNGFGVASRSPVNGSVSRWCETIFMVSVQELAPGIAVVSLVALLQNTENEF